jgi:regulator of protease activity HflC (stomatin/prohibitin superfamily)
MQALIDFVVRNILQLLPFLFVQSWNAAVRVRCGKIREELAPGFHWRIPYLDEARTYARTEVVADLKTAAITTTDGEAIVISGNVGFQLRSIRQMVLTVWSVDDSLRYLALGRLASECATRAWAALHGDARKALEEQLRASLNESVGGWGIEVTRVHLTDCVKARQQRFFLDGVPPR